MREPPDVGMPPAQVSGRHTSCWSGAVLGVSPGFARVKGQVCRHGRLRSMQTCPLTRPNPAFVPFDVSPAGVSGCARASRRGYAARSGERTAYLVLGGRALPAGLGR
ncbi:MAG: hypothetical protein V9F04_04935 [Dermatophilaceae bacterium]